MPFKRLPKGFLARAITERGNVGIVAADKSETGTV